MAMSIPMWDGNRTFGAKLAGRRLSCFEDVGEAGPWLEA